ncbi:hypothetical protein KL930_003067 [Ogataea haglerorum]|nr:hypothetical protein KL915_003641 [Ogataea haglerorum]KAG7704793.1 hypothetical protein KL950_003966 [Ogataea haglerorum]KAG7719223.1 hypothetical protein KL913_002221 [Ogataea haglerorum]KAG7719954.1 hypothetical protein KL949_001919 [Ogataea haglerorum]KAG7768409.1 hypothetical protein KL931_003015 [Ogataea haglerorum]
MQQTNPSPWDQRQLSGADLVSKSSSPLKVPVPDLPIVWHIRAFPNVVLPVGLKCGLLRTLQTRRPSQEAPLRLRRGPCKIARKAMELAQSRSSLREKDDMTRKCQGSCGRASKYRMNIFYCLSRLRKDDAAIYSQLNEK